MVRGKGDRGGQWFPTPVKMNQIIFEQRRTLIGFVLKNHSNNQTISREGDFEKFSRKKQTKGGGVERVNFLRG